MLDTLSEQHLIWNHWPLSVFIHRIHLPFLFGVYLKTYADSQVFASSNIQILDMGKTLKLLRATTEDAGEYSCKAINIAGSSEKDFFLDVLGEFMKLRLVFLWSQVQIDLFRT